MSNHPWKKRQYEFLKAQNFEYKYPPPRTELFLNNKKSDWYKRNENIIGKDGKFVIVHKEGVKTCLPKNIGINWWATIEDAYRYAELCVQRNISIEKDILSSKLSNKKEIPVDIISKSLVEEATHSQVSVTSLKAQRSSVKDNINLSENFNVEHRQTSKIPDEDSAPSMIFVSPALSGSKRSLHVHSPPENSQKLIRIDSSKIPHRCLNKDITGPSVDILLENNSVTATSSNDITIGVTPDPDNSIRTEIRNESNSSNEAHLENNSEKTNYYIANNTLNIDEGKGGFGATNRPELWCAIRVDLLQRSLAEIRKTLSLTCLSKDEITLLKADLWENHKMLKSILNQAETM